MLLADLALCLHEMSVSVPAMTTGWPDAAARSGAVTVIAVGPLSGGVDLVVIAVEQCCVSVCYGVGLLLNVPMYVIDSPDFCSVGCVDCAD